MMKSSVGLVVFDWAGTLVDFGCRAPLVAFLDAFAEAGLPITEDIARRPMGAHKRDHIREILSYSEVTQRVQTVLRREPDEALIDGLYEDFTRRLLLVLPRYAAPIPGAMETLAALRARGIRIGSTTGYTRTMMDVLEPLARGAGIRPDAVICADEVPQGRPAPWACFRLAERAAVFPMSRCWKVGDTPSDIAEGLNAGMVTVGVAATGNEVGLSEADLANLSAADRRARLAAASQRLRDAGAHHVLSSVADLPALLDEAGS